MTTERRHSDKGEEAEITMIERTERAMTERTEKMMIAR